MIFKESEKAIRVGDMIRVDDVTSDPKEIGESLLNEINVVGLFHDPNLFGGGEFYHVYRIKHGILYHMLLFPNRDLHLMLMQGQPTNYYLEVAPQQILAENEIVFFDKDGIIDIRKAHVPDCPNADQIRELLKS